MVTRESAGVSCNSINENVNSGDDLALRLAVADLGEVRDLARRRCR